MSVPALAALESLGVPVRPSSNTIRLIQDKYVQKSHFEKHGIPLGRYMDCPTVEKVKEAVEVFGLPLMLKSRKEGYDGRGNAVLRSLADVDEKFNLLYNGGKSGGVYCEGWVDFVDELAVMVVKSTKGEVKSYPTVTAIQRSSVCRVMERRASICARRCRRRARQSRSRSTPPQRPRYLEVMCHRARSSPTTSSRTPSCS